MEYLQMIPIMQIVESPTNPRRTFKKMEDLTQSVRENGVLVPLLVRSRVASYEIIAGARRFRAAREAGLLEVPAIVKDVTDDEALEIQVLENLQREDVHPLEEAIGYKALLDRPGHDVAAIAAKVGKSETYIYQRLKLADLIESARIAFSEDRLTVSHALLLARLQPEAQAEAMEFIYQDDYMADDDNPPDKACSVRELSEWIERSIHLDLKSAPFKMIDENLLAEAGSCINCPKRTGFIPQLFPDVAKKDTCTDSACYQRKVQAYIDSQIQKSQKKNQELVQITTSYRSDNPNVLEPNKYTLDEKESCDHIQKAIVVDGSSCIGEIKYICTDPKCKVHGKSEQSNHEESDWQKEQRERKDKAEKEQNVRAMILSAIADRIKDMPWTEYEWDALLNGIIEESQENILKIAATAIGIGEPEENIDSFMFDTIKSFPTNKFRAAITILRLATFVPVNQWSSSIERPPAYTEIARHYGVDVEAIELGLIGDKKAKKKSKK